MMRRATMVILLAVIAQLHAEKQAANRMPEADMLAKLSNRPLGASSLHDIDMDTTVVGKVGQVAIPQTRFLPVSTFPRVSSRSAGLRIPKASMNPQTDKGERTKDPAKAKVKETYGKLEALTNQMNKVKAQASSTPEVLPYTINIFVDGDEEKKYVNVKYMEKKIESALENVQDDVEAVDARLKIEGHSTPLYKMEVTVKMRQGKVVVSNPMLAESTFTEEVDHIHDTLKRSVRRDKEKRLAKFRKERRSNEPGEPEEQLSDDDE